MGGHEGRMNGSGYQRIRRVGKDKRLGTRRVRALLAVMKDKGSGA